MSTEHHKIDHYQYEFVSEASGQSARDMIYLFLFDAHKKLLCALACQPGKRTFAAAEMAAGGHVRAEIGDLQMRAIIDLLRNERPAWFSWNAATQSVRVSSNQEPVGEEEVRKMFSFLYL